MTKLIKQPNSKANHAPSVSTAIPTILACVNDLVFAEQIPEVTAAVMFVHNLVVILQPQQELFNITAPTHSVARTYNKRDLAATNTKVWHNRKRSANVRGRVVFFDNGQAAAWTHGDGEARFRLEQLLSVSHLDLLANFHGSQFESQVLMHCTEQEQRDRHTFSQLPHLRRDFERVVFEENA